MDILVVGIASSAGGLGPLTEVIEKAICHENMAFILVPHLSRDFESQLPKILKKFSTLQICRIEHNMKLKRCHLYVLPPGHYARVENHVLVLDKRPERGTNQSADVLFKSLAKEYGENAIGVVLSGAGVGADGTEGIIAIKEHGGHTYAQDPKTAEFPQMPESAIRTGMIDSVLSPEEIGNELTLVSWAEASDDNGTTIAHPEA